MATVETVDLGVAHEPKEESVKAFNEIEVELKKALQHARHDMNKHEPEYFAAVQDLSDEQLTTFSSDNLVLVRVATSAYGLHLFGKVRLPEVPGGAYFHFRAFVGGDTVKLHSIHTEETETTDGTKKYKAIFSEDDALEWFDT